MSDAFHWHGGRLDAARAHYGGGAEAWMDLSTGINPVPWAGASTINVDWRSLPDPSALAELEDAAAAHFGLASAHVCAVPGSETGLRMMGQLLDGPACYLTPGYRTHGAAFARAAPVTDPGQAPAGAIMLLANPNNPDGRIHMREQLRVWEDRAQWLIVDEAFADCMPHISVASQIGDGRKLIVLRSFGKFFGLAGVRLGFILGPAHIIAACRRMLGDWPVSAAAIAFGSAAYRDRTWIDAAIDALGERARQMDRLLARHGLEAKGHCPLFRLIEHDDAPQVFDRLARRSILTRPFEYRPDWLRFGLPADDAAMERLDRALADG
ncbi:aminotransferase class I/II-fold pyridoxal phosphate-dependent enzyme [Sphingobium sp. DC-2]|uniref:aminotransferase class I/II-fold pyridoxal phosphate-dependent enzyme n=1 Tax=Sphingobium sp. DC-2 TaxID=1303256 RepID=UPI0004C44A43|nr:aminotransferase class I/II-fold pyridoxal phosphate-dependent enzyme [Sphingobium sp. DC-2]